MKNLRLVSAFVGVVCVATILAQMIGIAVLFFCGRLTKSRLHAALAVVYEVDLKSWQGRAETANYEDREDIAYTQVLRVRLLSTLDLDLRESVLEISMSEVRRMEQELKLERRRYDHLKAGYDRLQQQQLGLAANAALIDVQQTLGSIKPKQAKQEILKMLKDGSRREVVTIMKGLPINKRKKIMAQFKTEEEAKALEGILREIRLGVPEVTLIRDTRQKLASLEVQPVPP